MRHAIAPALSLLLLASALPLRAGDATAADAIRALIERTERANNAGDVEGWVALFADDAVYMPPGSPPVTTREGLTDVARAGFRHRAAIHIEPLEIEVAGDWAFARSAVTGTVQLHGSGEVVEVDVKQIVIYRRSAGGEWKIARLITNSNRE
ncbi:MAG TPA: nuclear transport factor 2 family protein [Thermoanaerobaculia bacterium]|nr:nuclear transport factor 2 family protein [Thermoanaerobaculia bacterium]